jgi:hypothetical protein
MNSLFFPTTIIDGFLDNPETVREYGLGLEYRTDPNFMRPGKRSDYIHKLNPEFHDRYINKMLSIFYDDTTEIKTAAYSNYDLIDGRYGTDGSWLHTDMSKSKINGSVIMMTAILFLNKNPGTGVGIFDVNDLNYFNKGNDFHLNKRRESIKNLDIPEYRKAHDEYFDENIFVKGKFNRLVLFDARVWHGALGYYGTNDDDTRMTIVTTINSLLATDFSGRSVSLPMPRSKRSSEI